jgi:hypothetical protein
MLCRAAELRVHGLDLLVGVDEEDFDAADGLGREAEVPAPDDVVAGLDDVEGGVAGDGRGVALGGNEGGFGGECRAAELCGKREGGLAWC